MQFNVQALVLAAIAFEAAVAQPAHRHNSHKQFHARNLGEVLDRRQYNNPDGSAFTDAEWACFSEGKSPAECEVGHTGSGGSAGPAPAAGSAPASSPSPSSAPATQDKSVGASSQSDGGPGCHIYNKGSSTQTYVFFQNQGNTKRDYGSNTNPSQTVTIDAGSDKFISLPMSWKGHVQRSQSGSNKDSPATWAEFQISASNDGKAHGDISLEQGCDGAAEIYGDSEDNKGGFSHDVISGAPAEIIYKTTDGKNAIGYPTGGWMLGYSGALPVTGVPGAADYLIKNVGQKNAYIQDINGVPDIAGSSNVMHVIFY